MAEKGQNSFQECPMSLIRKKKNILLVEVPGTDCVHHRVGQFGHWKIPHSFPVVAYREFRTTKGQSCDAFVPDVHKLQKNCYPPESEPP